ncbi:hypothetical protein [Draconibacterium halophilum]|uniref:Uncharacterized protein n=1 Tax=Draconibacterium halophilum TaxID=2706887 RepID=A0A6C0R802_9BACT|nr:hypothetical protein [Draconibacterium halophilum]QIA06474.1 hypothetical protein G0Q07_01435 [Draconibacterium halophilum]
MKIHSKNWPNFVERFLQLKVTRFKFYHGENCGHTTFSIFADKVDEVTLEEFFQLEDARLPYFIKTPAGIFPKNVELGEGQNFVILVKFPSGNIIGLELCEKYGDTQKRICWIPKGLVETLNQGYYN